MAKPGLGCTANAIINLSPNTTAPSRPCEVRATFRTEESITVSFRHPYLTARSTRPRGFDFIRVRVLIRVRLVLLFSSVTNARRTRIRTHTRMKSNPLDALSWLSRCIGTQVDDCDCSSSEPRLCHPSYLQSQAVANAVRLESTGSGVGARQPHVTVLPDARDDR